MLIINGRSFEARLSCYQALVQAVTFDTAAFLWIDSICINQDDVYEKSHQVRRMFAVYAGADNVLARVGDHADDSKFLFDLPGRLEILRRPWNASDLKNVFTTFSSKSPPLDREHLPARLNDVFLKFGLRPYWNRLWMDCPRGYSGC